MRLWRLRDPSDDRFARAGWRGSWSTADTDVCSECSASTIERISPLLLNWLSGGDIVGDFTWPAWGAVVVDEVVDAFRPFGGFAAGPVHIVDDAMATRPGGDRPTVESTRLHELIPTSSFDVDFARSTVELEHECSTCGKERWAASGIERIESTYDPSTNTLNRTRVEREQGSGLFLKGAEPADAGVFRIKQFPAWICCTDEVKSTVEGFTNVSFLELGELEEAVTTPAA